MTDPMEPVQKLMEAFQKEIEPLGLEVHTFALLPNPDGPPHMVQAMLTFNGEELTAIQEQAAQDVLNDTDLSDEERAMFEALTREEKRSDDEAKAEEAAAALQRLQESLEKGSDGGILGD